MRKYLFLASIVACCFLFSCNDDDLDPNKDPGGETELDEYLGEGRELVFGDELAEFEFSEFKCRIQAENGDVITRRGTHIRTGQKSTINFINGLRDGEYRILSLDNKVAVEGHDSINHDFPMGCKIKVQSSQITVESRYNTSFRMFVEDEGTDSVFIISAPSHFVTLREIANNAYSNALLKDNLVYKMVADIDMDDVCFNTNWDTGWVAIGLSTAPFRGTIDGQNHKITNLWGGETGRCGMALFGYVGDAVFKNITMENTDVKGSFAVGSLIGATLNPGDKTSHCALINCHSVNNNVYGVTGSVGIGGLVGVVDMYNLCSLQDCTNNGSTIEGDYSVGGLVGAGALGSTTLIQGCSNGIVSTSSHTTPASTAATPTSPGTIVSNYNCAGGIVGGSDSLIVIGCVNEAPISGGFKLPSGTNNKGIGAGGIVGGSQSAVISACTNNGDVTGRVGVGGIIGSTRAGTDETIFQNAIVMTSSNTGDITGSTSIGGICGEAQFGGFTVMNTGKISANTIITVNVFPEGHIGGIVGHASMAVVYNAMNRGSIEGTIHCSGGVIGKMNMGSVFCCQNFGPVNCVSQYRGGVIGRAGNYTSVQYCLNDGNLLNQARVASGGIVGEIGDPREWTGMDIANCVLGTMKIFIGAAQCALNICAMPYSVALDLDQRNGTALAELAATNLEKCSHSFLCPVKVLKYARMGVSYCLSFYDKIKSIRAEESEELQKSIDDLQEQKFTELYAEMTNYRSTYTLRWHAVDGLNKEFAQKCLTNTNALMDYYYNGDASTNDNQLTIETNINMSLGERESEVQHFTQVKNIISSVIGGTVAIVSGVASVVSFGGTLLIVEGTAISVCDALCGGLAVVGGAQTVCKEMTDYVQNVVVVSQCVNTGAMDTNYEKSEVDCGGIVGRLQEFSVVRDCANLGPQEILTYGGSIAGFVGHQGVVERCLMLGTCWSGFPYDDGQTGVHSNDNYTYDHQSIYTDDCDNNGTTVLSLQQMYTSGSFKNWDFTSSVPRWEVDGQSGNYPIPYKSETQDPIQ